MEKVVEALEKGIEVIEEQQSLDGVGHGVVGVVSKVTADTRVKNLLSGTWLGHPVHPMLTDVPIGAYTMATVIDATVGPSGATAARRLIGVGLVATVPAAATGASDWTGTHGPTQRLGLVHGLLNTAATLIQAASWTARRRGRRGTGTALSALGLGITAASAYLGAHLSYRSGIGVDHTAFQSSGEEWTDVAAAVDLREGRLLRAEADGVPVMLVKLRGTPYALSATCTHAGGALDEGEIVDDDCVRCPLHGSVFRLSDGTVVRGPATAAEPCWEVKVEGERVLVRSGGSG
jgi:nitrite reductase/ring-hydroxylating ferredoxin subunit/uncharacterized membrane protein